MGTKRQVGRTFIGFTSGKLSVINQKGGGVAAAMKSEKGWRWPPRETMQNLRGTDCASFSLIAFNPNLVCGFAGGTMETYVRVRKMYATGGEYEWGSESLLCGIRGRPGPGKITAWETVLSWVINEYNCFRNCFPIKI